MPDDKKSTGIPWLDNAFDLSERVVEGVERAFTPPASTSGHVQQTLGTSNPTTRAQASIDDTTGRWVVEVAGREYGARNAGDANWLCDFINAAIDDGASTL